MILLIDIGNTYTKISSNDERLFMQFSTSSYNEKEDLKKLDSFSNGEYDVDGAIISSVVKDKEKLIKEYLDDIFGINSIILNYDLKFNIQYPEKDKNELGGDLIAIMESAALNDESFIGVSLGTATVFVAVKNKKFVGCAIAPGVFTSLNGLVNSASLISETKLSGSYSLLGMDTESSLKSGLWNGFTFLVEGYIKKIREELDMKDANVYIVGGFADPIIKNLQIKNLIYDKDLIFKGLYEIYKLNK